MAVRLRRREASPKDRIFINYRRDDSAGFAGRLADSLGAWFGPERIFRDVCGIGYGEDFERCGLGARRRLALEQQVQHVRPAGVAEHLAVDVVAVAVRGAAGEVIVRLGLFQPDAAAQVCFFHPSPLFRLTRCPTS